MARRAQGQDGETRAGAVARGSRSEYGADTPLGKLGQKPQHNIGAQIKNYPRQGKPTQLSVDYASEEADRTGEGLQ
jgi:hypothetical protein